MLAAIDGRMSGGFQQSCGESSEEELSVLPRHTKVVVTGNNRTKSVLVGLQGVVKKAVGLGGWHWLVITFPCSIVKLQRNALSVIEAPSGHEEDDEIECENMQWNSSDMGKDPIGLVNASRNPSKEQLIEVVERHFMSQVSMNFTCIKICHFCLVHSVK
ncbi:hypothetical protein BHE74_00011638 [Ensete ventricosum]|nr:hypothetical protein BHE74_00011638 [Ensete ventricosum]